MLHADGKRASILYKIFFTVFGICFTTAVFSEEHGQYGHPPRRFDISILATPLLLYRTFGAGVGLKHMMRRWSDYQLAAGGHRDGGEGINYQH